MKEMIARLYTTLLGIPIFFIILYFFVDGIYNFYKSQTKFDNILNSILDYASIFWIFINYTAWINIFFDIKNKNMEMDTFPTPVFYFIPIIIAFFCFMLNTLNVFVSEKDISIMNCLRFILKGIVPLFIILLFTQIICDNFGRLCVLQVKLYQKLCDIPIIVKYELKPFILSFSLIFFIYILCLLSGFWTKEPIKDTAGQEPHKLN